MFFLTLFALALVFFEPVLTIVPDLVPVFALVIVLVFVFMIALVSAICTSVVCAFFLLLLCLFARGVIAVSCHHFLLCRAV